ncbi:MAG: extracellular solute-binding protein [Actinobacteria bacterium]|nr:extracellular solute-binding protein [Actinomycetota bacterium]
MHSRPANTSGVTRRSLLQQGLAIGGAFAATGLLGACTRDGNRADETGPLNLVGWRFAPEIVEKHVRSFEQLYDEKCKYELVSGEYPSVVETKLIGGESYDMFYAEESHFERWLEGGWTRTIEGLPGAAEMAAEKLTKVAVQSLSTRDGKLAALPYYSGHLAFFYNEEHTSKLQNFAPPNTWDEVLDVCREIKSRGIAKYPFISSWGASWAFMSWALFGMWYSEGEPVFDEDFKPTFGDGDTGFTKVLKWCKQMYDEELVPPDILTYLEEPLGMYQSGAHTFMIRNDYDQKVLNDPAESKIPGAVKNAMMPGASRETYAWTSGYLMGADAPEDRTWNLLKFFGGKAKDGEFHVSKRWALDFGLGTPWKELAEDPEVIAAWKKWRDLEVTRKQGEASRIRAVAKALWFPEWDTEMMTNVQDYIQGKTQVGPLVAKLATKADELRERNP